MKFYVHFAFLLVSLSSCSRLYLGDDFVREKTVLGNRIDICYELIGWEHDDYKKHASDVLSSLHNSRQFGKISSSVKSSLKNRIQIVLISNQFIKPLFGEQTEPTSWMVERKSGTTFLTILNRMIAYRTFLLIPYLAKDDTQITFRHWNGNRLIRDYTYSLKNLVAIGWIPLLFRPFDDHEEVESMYTKATKKFISEFQGELP